MCAHSYTQWSPRKGLEIWLVSFPTLPAAGRGAAPGVTLKQVTSLQHPVHHHHIVYLLSFFPSFCPDYAISKPDLMSQMERGERPTMQEQEDSEEGETPADPSAGEWLPAAQLCLLDLSAWGVTTQSRPWMVC